MKKLCRECEERVDEDLILSVSRKGGGNYRRAPRWYTSSICSPCARGCLERATEGHRICGSAKWSVSGLRHALSRLDEQGQ